jgi:anaerobic selenocysteine-containing dehydrogenase
VVFDDFMTETAKLADIILPASTFLERTQHKEYGSRNTGYVTLRRAVVGPLWESWPDWKFWFELAKRMGYREYFPWDDVEETIEFILKPSGVTLEQLKKNPEGIYFFERRYRSYEERGFGTPSKKVEIYSEMLRKYGYDPLPIHVEPEESPVNSPGLARDYPLILTTGSRIFEYTHSQLRNIPRLRERVPDPYAEINPQTARESNIHDSDEIIVESKRGFIKLKAKVTEDVPTWLVNIPHGWAEANVNLLTDDGGRDPISGFPPLKSLLCRVRKPSLATS